MIGLHERILNRASHSPSLIDLVTTKAIRDFILGEISKMASNTPDKRGVPLVHWLTKPKKHREYTLFECHDID